RKHSRPHMWLLALAVVAVVAMIIVMLPSILPAVPYPIQNLGVRGVVIMVLLVTWLGSLLVLFLESLNADSD
ncbi:MAG: hypothetical protein ACHQ4H_18955, partial [Ktedonobacterales bacterium]